MADEATGPQKRRYTRVTPARHAEMVRLKARGKDVPAIAKRTGVAECTVSRVLRSPLTQAQVPDLSKRLGLDKQAIRERAKELISYRSAASLEKAHDVLDEKLDLGDAKDAHFAAQVIERLDRVSGNTVGEGQRIIHDG